MAQAGWARTLRVGGACLGGRVAVGTEKWRGLRPCRSHGSPSGPGSSRI